MPAGKTFNDNTTDEQHCSNNFAGGFEKTFVYRQVLATAFSSTTTQLTFTC